MKDPRVLAVCLTADRHAMTARAVESWKAQTYVNRSLFVRDTGIDAYPLIQDHGIYGEHWPVERGRTIGALRNLANAYASPHCLNADIIIHFDSDDISHPSRIAEQVALLQASGKECVGYRECLFWRTPQNEAWKYQNADPRHCLGASLAYYRSTWEQNPFRDLPQNPHGTGEDNDFVKRVSSLGISALAVDGPRLVCSIHGANSSGYDLEELVRRGSPNWDRVPQFDAGLERRMVA